MINEYTIADGVLAFSTTRNGGVSEGYYSEFNINDFCGDNPEHIVVNRKLLADKIGVVEGHFVMAHQVHGVEVKKVDAELFSLSEDARKETLDGFDALMTDETGICIGVSTADCIPVLLYDEAHHAVAAIHAGWRGTVARIVLKTVQKMISAYHTDPKDLKAVVGPGISLANFEVGDEVYEQFKQAAFDMNLIAEQRPATDQPLKWHISLPLCNQLTLQKAGVKEENIFQSGICTYDRSEEYFSARKLGIKSGRIFTAIMLK